MTEIVKTALFLVTAIALAGVAYVTQPKAPEINRDKMVGRVLFARFEDPKQAASLEIIRYDEELGEIHNFEVTKRGGLWQIPSHADYPADAEDQLQDAALSLVGLKVLGVVTEEPGEHEMFGVIEPNKETTKLGDQGVGVVVGLEDDKGNELARLIIGGEVRNSEGHRFVRVPSQDIVYDVEIDPERLSTKFADWIEEDLLKLTAFDVEQLTMKDYSVVRVGDGTAAQLALRTDISVNWNATDNKWELERLNTYRQREAIPTELLPTEELDTERLNEAKNALADLKIVDVRRKPKGLGANLRLDATLSGDGASNEESQDLIRRGFYPNKGPTGEFELLSANGEIHVRMKGGHRYLLRFGGVEGTDDDSDSGGLNRYMFVTADVDYSQIPEPVLEPLPGESVTGSESSDPANAGDDDAAERRQIAERERITKENQRKTDDWNDRKKSAEAKANELNTRFADWYYVIAEDIYRKIHLTRSDIIKEAAQAADEGFGVDSFRQLESSGLRKPGE